MSFSGPVFGGGASQVNGQYVVFNVDPNDGPFTVPILQKDIYLYCDTSSLPVIINIPPIADFNDFQSKLYISDINNNAGTNSITINVAGGDTINNENVIILNNNGAS